MRTAIIVALLLVTSVAEAQIGTTGRVVIECHFDEDLQPKSVAKASKSSTPVASGLVVKNATWTTNGFIRGAYQFKGKGIIKAHGFNQPSETGEISLSVWVKPSIDLKEGVKRNQITSDCWGPHQLEYERGGLLLELYDEKHRSHRYHYKVALAKDKWHHIGFTARTGHQVRMFINGDRVPATLIHIMKDGIIVEVAEDDPKVGSCEAPATFDKQTDDKKKRLHIGAEGYNRWYFHGIIDELTIWSQEVPPGQMRQIYKDQLAESKRQKGKK